MHVRLGLLVLSLVTAAAACDGGGAEYSIPVPPSAPVRPVLVPPSQIGLARVSADVPETAVGAQLEWVLDTLNVRIDELTDEQVTEHFDPSVLEVVSAADLASELRRLNGRTPYALVGFAEEPTPARLVAVVADGMATYRMVTIEVGAKPEARLTALNFQPYTPEVESP